MNDGDTRVLAFAPADERQTAAVVAKLERAIEWAREHGADGVVVCLTNRDQTWRSDYAACVIGGLKLLGAMTTTLVDMAGRVTEAEE